MTPMVFAAWMNFSPALGPAGWAALGGVPVGIIALYFLKLRRRPVEVPSTLLWRRSLEDLHVNSLFQRLRKNLLLFLQLLIIALAALALTGPRVEGTNGPGQRYILAIDESASMGATDTGKSRLDDAKAAAAKVIDNMEADDLAMVVAFADRARVVSNYSGNKSLLRQRLASIAPTQRTTSLLDALQVVAGLALPSKDFNALALPQGVIASGVVPPKLYVFTDGGFADVAGFSLGNVEPEVVVIGPAPEPVPGTSLVPSDNVAIVALQAGRADDRPDLYQVFGRVHNYKGEAVQTEAKLYRRDPARPADEPRLIDAVSLAIDPGADQSFKFDLAESGAAELEVRIDSKDSLPLDDRAYAVFGTPRRAQVLLVTPGNRFLANALKTPYTASLADLTIATAEEIKAPELARDLAAGRFDLAIFDGVRPDKAPECNTLSFGAIPPPFDPSAAKTAEFPVILDWNLAHPLTQYLRDLTTLIVKKASVIDPPVGATVLIEGSTGPLAFAASRSGFVDAVVAFPLLENKELQTDWPLKLSFPLFLSNVVKTLGNARDAVGGDAQRPGQAVVLRADADAKEIVVTAPDGKSTETLKRSTQNTFLANQVEQTGIYHARWGEKGSSAFAVNLFDSRESDLSTRGLAPVGTPADKAEAYQIKIGYKAVAGSPRPVRAVKDWWKYLAGAALVVVLAEWYIYNKRVYV